MQTTPWNSLDQSWVEKSLERKLRAILEHVESVEPGGSRWPDWLPGKKVGVLRWPPFPPLSVVRGRQGRHRWCSGEKSNKCNQCDFASARAGNLRPHVKIHNREKPFPPLLFEVGELVGGRRGETQGGEAAAQIPQQATSCRYKVCCSKLKIEDESTNTIFDTRSNPSSISPQKNLLFS